MDMRTIDVNRLLSFCDTHTIGQSVTGRLLVTVGKTKRGDDIYKDLLEFEEIYTPLCEDFREEENFSDSV